MTLTDRFHSFVSPSRHDSGLVEQAPPVAAAQIARRFWPYARPYRRQIALGLLLLLVVPAIDAVEIYLFKLVVDDVLVPQALAALWPIAAAYVGLALAGAIASFADDYVATWVGERFLLDLRAHVFGHVQSLSADQLGSRRVGDLLARLTGDVAAIENFLLSALGEGFGALARIVFFAGAMFLLSWKLALAALIVAPLFLIVARHFARLVKRVAREKRRRTGSLTAVAEESLNSAPLVQSLNRQKVEVDRFKRESAAIMDAEMAATRVNGIFGPMAGFIELLGGMLVIGAGVVALTAGELTLGGLLIFITYLAGRRRLGRPRARAARRGAGRRAGRCCGRRVMRPLGAGREIVPGTRVLAHLHRSNGLDVYDAYNEPRACRVIVKTVRPDKLRDSKTRARLLREGRMLKRFTHPHLVRAYEIHDGDRPVVVMETLTGRTLDHLISGSSRPLSAAELAHLATHLASALRYLHGEGILHLDLKPSNVIAEQARAKVIDLSHARPPGRMRAGNGTWCFMAPEQARGGEVTAAADAWGLGIVLHEAMVGHCALSRIADELDVDEPQLHARVPSLRRERPRLPAALSGLADACLEPEPGNRPTIDDALRNLEGARLTGALTKSGGSEAARTSIARSHC